MPVIKVYLTLEEEEMLRRLSHMLKLTPNKVMKMALGKFYWDALQEKAIKIGIELAEDINKKIREGMK